MNISESIQKTGKDLFINLPRRISHTTPCQKILTPLLQIISIPSMLCNRASSTLAKKTTTTLSYFSHLIPKCIKKEYEALCIKRAEHLMHKLEPQFQVNPKFIVFLLLAQAYAETDRSKRYSTYWGAFVSALAVFADFLYLHIPGRLHCLSKEGILRKKLLYSYEKNKEQLSKRLIAPLIQFSDKQILKKSTTYLIQFVYQEVINEGCLQALNKLSPSIQTTFHLSDKSLHAAKWSLRAYLYLPLLYQIGKTAYAGYQHYHRLHDIHRSFNSLKQALKKNNERHSSLSLYTDPFLKLFDVLSTELEIPSDRESEVRAFLKTRLLKRNAG